MQLAFYDFDSSRFEIFSWILFFFFRATSWFENTRFLCAVTLLYWLQWNGIKFEFIGSLHYSSNICWPRKPNAGFNKVKLINGIQLILQNYVLVNVLVLYWFRRNWALIFFSIVSFRMIFLRFPLQSADILGILNVFYRTVNVLPHLAGSIREMFFFGYWMEYSTAFLLSLSSLIAEPILHFYMK